MDLFDKSKEAVPPLADRMRPRTLAEFVGQEAVVGAGKPLVRLLDGGRKPPSMILWGPPGTGKTTLARIVAETCKLPFLQLSAVTSGIKDVKEAVETAKATRSAQGKPTLLFIDEIHRFNKAQQDAFLPHVESGLLILVGSTTENPSFEVNPALLSRCSVYTLRSLTMAEVRGLLDRAVADPERGLGKGKIEFEEGVLDWIADLSGGDARQALNLLETAAGAASGKVTLELARDVAQRRARLYDAGGEEHYNVASAFIKSMRGSDPDAAIYWMARMLENGEDPLFIARRMVIFASEDVGNADPRGLMVAVAAMQAVHFIGMPEGFYPLSQACLYLATASKSNSAGQAYAAAKKDVDGTRNDPVPLHLRNATTKLMEEMGYNKGYQYAHDGPVTHAHLPENLQGRVYYEPRESGAEAAIRKWLEEKRKRKA